MVDIPRPPTARPSWRRSPTPKPLAPAIRGAAEAGQTVAGEQRLEAAQALDTPDNRATPQDEHAQGQTAGADHLEYADASSARAAGIADKRVVPQAPSGLRSPPVRPSGARPFSCPHAGPRPGAGKRRPHTFQSAVVARASRRRERSCSWLLTCGSDAPTTATFRWSRASGS